MPTDYYPINHCLIISINVFEIHQAVQIFKYKNNAISVLICVQNFISILIFEKEITIFLCT